VGIFLFCLFWFSLFFEASGLNRDWAEGVIKRAKWTKHRPVSIFILSKCHSLTLVASNGRWKLHWHLLESISRANIWKIIGALV